MLAEMSSPQKPGDQADSPGGRVVTSWAEVEPFDRAAYEASPNEYLNKIRPARVFDPAQPGQDVTPLEQISPGLQSVLQGEQVVLKVKATPGSPVAFYTPQVGWFTENLLTSVTVKADETGIARVTFKAGPGSIGLVDVLAASPVHSRQLQFRIKVDLPRKNGRLAVVGFRAVITHGTNQGTSENNNTQESGHDSYALNQNPCRPGNRMAGTSEFDRSVASSPGSGVLSHEDGGI